MSQFVTGYMTLQVSIDKEVDGIRAVADLTMDNQEILSNDDYYSVDDMCQDFDLYQVSDVEDAVLSGDYDYVVESRIDEMDYTPRNFRVESALQLIHQMHHPDGPYGYEFCYKCMKGFEGFQYV